MNLTLTQITEYFKKHKLDFNDDNMLIINSRLAASDCTTSDLIDLYGLKYLYLFRPSTYICSRLLNLSFQNIDILKCCIMFNYNDLYFDNTPEDFCYELYKIAAKSNNKDIYDHQVSLCDDLSLLDINLCFDYSIYYVHTLP